MSEILNTHLLAHSVLEDFAKEVFLKMGHTKENALLASQVLIKADLRGIDSHGMARLSGYVRLWQKKRINANPILKTLYETNSTASLDGDAGLGLVIGPKAMDMAIEKAEYCGSGWIAVKNSNHFGIAAYHAMKALPRDMIGIAMTNASPLVAPALSIERMLGTNPMCFAFPSGSENPVVVDMATSAAANGKLELAQYQNKEIPEGWVQDSQGRSSTSPFELKKGGSLLPLGGDRDHGSHKGYALGSVVDILSAVLSGANYGPWVPPFVSFLEPSENPVGEGLGHFFGALRVDGFRPVEEFKKNMDNWIKRFNQAQPSPGNPRVLVPGEPEFIIELEREKNGIPLLKSVYRDLLEIGKQLELEPKF
jgi:LDH2 family malate/lactate/ureidoglycolate dehydrogenase